jgi:hypothetical protein
VSTGVPLIVLTNGRRDCLTRTISSAERYLAGVAHLTVVDDSGDDKYTAWLVREFGGGFDARVRVPSGQTGYWRAMQAVWQQARFLLDESGVNAAVFLEDDFVFNGDVDLDCLHTVLCQQAHLTQIALLRQSWFGNEREHGGVIEALEAQGHDFKDCSDGVHSWVEHRACFTGNPCLIPRRTFERDWPEGAWSESRFGRELFADPAARGAYWGRRGDPPLVEHIGHERVGSNY